MTTLEEQIEVAVPADRAWAQLHRVADYPRFVDGVQHAWARGHTRAHLDVEIGDTRRTFDAEITDRGRGRVMTWQTLDGPPLRCTVALRPLDAARTQVQIRLEYDPDRLRDALGGPRGFAQAGQIERTVRSDLEQLKHLLEHGRTG